MPPPNNCPHIASVVALYGSSGVSVHSQSILQASQPLESMSLWAILASWGNEAVWKNSSLAGDEWIKPAYTRGSLILCHDGSYMPHQDNTRCLAGVLMICTKSTNQGHIAFCEHTDSKTASNYRGEIIGGVIATLLLWALSRCASPPSSNASISIYCDNLGVVCHGNDFL